MFCPVCGSKKVVDVFCLEHLREQRPLVKEFKPFRVEVCSVTGAVHHKGKWHPTEHPEEVIRGLLAEHIIPAQYAEISAVRAEPLPLELKTGLKIAGEAIVTVTGRASPRASWYDEEYAFPFEIQNTLSPRLRKHGGYFEGTLQVRNETEETKRFVRERVAAHEARIAKEVAQPTGTDYYISSNSAARHVAQELQQYGGKMKLTRKLFSRNRQTSKDLYRVTAHVQLPEYQPGDVVKEQDPLLVKRLSKKIQFQNLRTGKTEYHEYRPMQRLLVAETSVATDHPTITVIHPETFQAVPLANRPSDPVKPGAHVEVAIDGERLYLVERQ